MCREKLVLLTSKLLNCEKRQKKCQNCSVWLFLLERSLQFVYTMFRLFTPQFAPGWHQSLHQSLHNQCKVYTTFFKILNDSGNPFQNKTSFFVILLYIFKMVQTLHQYLNWVVFFLQFNHNFHILFRFLQKKLN